jgi:hypothetical protein
LSPYGGAAPIPEFRLKRKWTRGANGLWTTFDPAHLKDIGSTRAAGVRQRLATLLDRDGWLRRGSRWRQFRYWQLRDAEKAAREARRAEKQST